MREPILKAVAQPPKLFWAPFLPAVANLAIQFPLMFIGMGLWNFNPLLIAPFILGVHIALIFYGAKEPHLSSMCQAWGPMATPSKNMNKSKGNKLAP